MDAVFSKMVENNFTALCAEFFLWYNFIPKTVNTRRPIAASTEKRLYLGVVWEML